MNYENLTDPSNGVDQESKVVTMTMKQIATLYTLWDPPVDEEAAFALAEEAENLARKSLTIIERQNRPSYELKKYYSILGDVLLKRGKYTDELRIILERSLALGRQQPAIYASSLRVELQLLIEFHGHMSEILPEGEAKNRELELQDEYQKEIKQHM